MYSFITRKLYTHGRKGDALEEPSPVYERLHGMNWEVQQKREKKRQVKYVFSNNFLMMFGIF